MEQRSGQPEAGEASEGNAEELGARVCVCVCLSKSGEGGAELRSRDWSWIASFTSSWASGEWCNREYCPKGSPNSCVCRVVPHEGHKHEFWSPG